MAIAGLRLKILSSCYDSDYEVADDRKAVVAAAVGTWAFAADDFTDDELLYGAFVMLEHALKMPEVEQWHRTTGMKKTSLSVHLQTSATTYAAQMN